MVSIQTGRRSEILSKLTEFDRSKLFSSPPDRKAFPYYDRVVPKHIDLPTIWGRINKYTHSDGFFDDLVLMFTNAIRFYSPSTRIHQLARDCLAWTVKERAEFDGCTLLGDEEEVTEEEALQTEEEEETPLKVEPEIHPAKQVSSRGKKREYAAFLLEQTRKEKKTKMKEKKYKAPLTYIQLTRLGNAIRNLTPQHVERIYKILQVHAVKFEQSDTDITIVLTDLDNEVIFDIQKYIDRQVCPS